MSGRIAWTEGMALSPHHFQYSDEHIAHLLKSEILGRGSFWGLRSFDHDSAALRSGVVQVRSCSGYFSDGTAFDACAGSKPLPSRSIAEHLAPSLESIGIFLGQSLTTQNRGALGSAYDVVESTLPDFFAGGAPRKIQFAEPSYQLLFSTEEMSSFRVLKIGEITRDEQGLPAFSKQYIPSLVRIDASSLLRQMLQRLVDACLEKQTTLRAQRAGATASNIDALLTLLALQSSVPVLGHFLATGGAHPEQLYLELARLASALNVNGSAAQGVPVYGHDALGKVFRELSELILNALRVEQKSNFAIAVFTQQNPMLFQANPSWNFGEFNSFYVAIKSSLPISQVHAEVAKGMKLSSPSQLQGLVASALRGVEITVVAEAPAGIRDAERFAFFKVQTSGNFWEEVLRSKNIAAYVNPALQVQELNLIGVH